MRKQARELDVQQALIGLDLNKTYILLPGIFRHPLELSERALPPPIFIPISRAAASVTVDLIRAARHRRRFYASLSKWREEMVGG